MLYRILSEDEITGPIRAQIERLTTSQLLFLEEVIQREKQKRQRETLAKWKEYLREAREQGFLPNKGVMTFDE